MYLVIDVQSAGEKSKIFLILFLAVQTLFGCVKSPPPQVSEIITIRAPTFLNKASTVISSPAVTYTLSGECDGRAVSTEYSIDDGAWTQVDCINDAFSVGPLNLAQGYSIVKARSNGKFSTTATASATVRFLLPPTSDLITAATSSRSEKSDYIGSGTQNVMASMGVEASTGTNIKLKTLGPRLIYEP